MSSESTLENEFGVITRTSPRSVVDTVSRLLQILAAKKVRLFSVIDQRDEARQVGLDMPETTLVIFGNPSAGTPIMIASPLTALDLPLKLLIWADGERTKVSYYSPESFASRHHISEHLAANLASIHALSDALVAE